MTSLPAKYKPEAKQSLAKCERVDECKDWADKAMALKSYAKQMKDTSLENMAQRIRDRAVRRGGELLAQVKAQRGGDRKSDRSKGGHPPIDRKIAAKAAGLSPDQAKQMVRVASVPPDEFERRVERPKPATVEELANSGIKKSGRVKPEPFRNDEWLDWTHAVQHLASLPGCGLEVLAARRPDETEALHGECKKALINLKMWNRALESEESRRR